MELISVINERPLDLKTMIGIVIIREIMKDNNENNVSKHKLCLMKLTCRVYMIYLPTVLQPVVLRDIPPKPPVLGFLSSFLGSLLAKAPILLGAGASSFGALRFLVRLASKGFFGSSTFGWVLDVMNLGGAAPVEDANLFAGLASSFFSSLGAALLKPIPGAVVVVLPKPVLVPSPLEIPLKPAVGAAESLGANNIRKNVSYHDFKRKIYHL